MNTKKKLIIFFVILIIIAMIIVFCVSKFFNGEEEKNEQINESDTYYTILEDGTKVNTSEKLKQKRGYDGLEISNIELTTNENITRLLGIITNKTSEIKGDYIVNFVLIDRNGKELCQMPTYIKQIKPEERIVLNTSITFDYANAYDLIIKN